MVCFNLRKRGVRQFLFFHTVPHTGTKVPGGLAYQNQ